jgi:hypothetical protein
VYYPFNGNANDESENGNHGRVHAATLSEGRFGNANSAYRFDVGNSILSTNRVGISGNHSRTITAWIKWSFLHRDFTPVCGWGENRNNGRFAIVTEWRKRPNLECFDQSQAISIWLWGTQCGCELNSTIVPHLRQWYHVVGVHDGGVTKIYLNGKLNGIKSVTLNTGDGRLAVGSRKFGGVIDEVRVYDRALSGSEIEELYQSAGR